MATADDFVNATAENLVVAMLAYVEHNAGEVERATGKWNSHVQGQITAQVLHKAHNILWEMANDNRTRVSVRRRLGDLHEGTSTQAELDKMQALLLPDNTAGKWD